MCVQEAQKPLPGPVRNPTIQGNVLNRLPIAATELFQMDKTRTGPEGWLNKDFMIEFFPECQCISGRQLTRRNHGCSCHCAGDAMQVENTMKDHLKQILRDSSQQWWLFSQVRLGRPGKRQLYVDCVVMLHVHDTPCSQCSVAIELDGSMHTRASVHQLEHQRALRGEKSVILQTLGVNLLVWPNFIRSGGLIDPVVLEQNRQQVLDWMRNLTEL